MNVFYVISVVYLMINFLLYKKTDKKLCLWSLIIYSFGLLFCYNTFVVYLVYLLKINGSMLLYGLINFVIGTILLIFLKKRKKQEYYYDKNKLYVILVLGIIVFFISCFTFRNFEVISFESGDSAIHYRHALEFSENLAILDKSNSQDIIYNSFERVMPISYVNCGLLFNIFSWIKPYKVFLYFNVVFLIISSLVFLVTIIDIFKYKKNNYVNALAISLIYTLAFPFNNFLMGFCYLSLSIIVINLLLLTIFNFKDSFDSNVVYKIVVILLLTFSCFYSYYQFIPAIYLSLGLYYISLWKKNKIDLKKLLLYGVITLIIPFISGCYYFLISWIMDKGVSNIISAIGFWGYCYNNVTPLYLFLVISIVLAYALIKKKKLYNDKFNYLKINMVVLSFYMAIFVILFMVGISDLYYLYKLMSVYWLLVMLFFVPEIIKLKKYIYSLFILIIVLNVFAYYNTDNEFFKLLRKTNIYTWNTLTLIDDRIIINKDELEIMEQSKKYADVCEQNNRFLMIGDSEKNLWYYSLTDMIPVYTSVEGDTVKLSRYRIPNFNTWEYYYSMYDCVIYYYEGMENNKEAINRDNYEVLYENDAGIIVKRFK